MKNIGNTKILLLFGAGASYDVGGINKIVPKSDGLFDNLCNNYPNSWGNIKGDLKGKFISEGFEIGMDALYKTPEKHRYMVAPLLKELAIYFSKFKIINQQLNLYAKLAKRFHSELNNRKIIVSTLNYECLIEYALFYSGINDIYSIDGVNSKLLKLHGSCNFIPIGFTDGGLGLKLAIDSSTINTDYNIVDPEKVEEALAIIPIPAAMSLFTHEKRNIVAPVKLKIFRDEFKEYTHTVKLIILVGVKPNLGIDPHIWDPLASTQAKILFIGDEEKCNKWISKYAKTRGEYIGKYFNKEFDKLCKLIEEELSS